MTIQKDKLWAIYINNNPNWATEGANLTPAGLKKLFETTFDKGHELGLANGKAIANRDNKQNKSPVSDIIGSIFNQ